MLYIYLSLPLGWVFIPISLIIGWCGSTGITGICSQSVVLSSGESLYPGNLVLIHRLIHVKQCNIVSSIVIYESATANEKQASDYRCSFHFSNMIEMRVSSSTCYQVTDHHCSLQSLSLVYRQICEKQFLCRVALPHRDRRPFSAHDIYVWLKVVLWLAQNLYYNDYKG